VRARFAELAARVSDETGTSRAAEAVAEGFLKIAVENMANAIKKISVQRGWVASKREPEGEEGGGRRGGRAVRRGAKGEFRTRERLQKRQLQRRRSAYDRTVSVGRRGAAE